MILSNIYYPTYLKNYGFSRLLSLFQYSYSHSKRHGRKTQPNAASSEFFMLHLILTEAVELWYIEQFSTESSYKNDFNLTRSATVAAPKATKINVIQNDQGMTLYQIILKNIDIPISHRLRINGLCEIE